MYDGVMLCGLFVYEGELLSNGSAIWGMEKYLEAAKERRRKLFEVLSVREQKVSFFVVLTQ